MPPFFPHSHIAWDSCVRFSGPSNPNFALTKQGAQAVTFILPCVYGWDRDAGRGRFRSVSVHTQAASDSPHPQHRTSLSDIPNTTGRPIPTHPHSHPHSPFSPLATHVAERRRSRPFRFAHAGPPPSRAVVRDALVRRGQRQRRAGGCVRRVRGRPRRRHRAPCSPRAGLPRRNRRR